jgi:predicted secreted protein
MAIAAHPGAVHFAATDTTGEVDGITSYEMSVNGEMLDTTDFKDTSGWHSRILGLMDATFTVSGDVESADSPQLLMRSTLATGATSYIRILPDGSTGFKCAVKTQDYKISGEVNGKAQFSATFVATGAISTV